ncbi:MAG: hypothetical protein J6P61_08260 [Erysipelotrichaceae bacterium]|nr:hypothetical protein [Erysipelotrichaceae bacterium]
MKRVLSTLLTILLTLSLTACGSKKSDEASVTNTDPVIETQDKSVDDDQGNIADWAKAKDGKDVAKQIGWENDEFVVPESFEFNDNTFSDPQFSTYLSVGQALYEFGAMSVYIRKAVGIYGGPITDRDIEKNEFSNKWKQKVGKFSVDCYGNEKGSAIVALWVDGSKTYCITSQGLGGEDVGMPADIVENLVKAVK